MHPVYIRSAELGEPFTDKPRASLRELMLRAGERAVAQAGLEPRSVDALFVAAMGSFPHEQFLGALPLWLANRLGLRNADVSPMLIGSSESGAWALRRAFEALRRSDEFRHAIIIAGEQMNPLIEHRATTQAEKDAERLARNQTIAQVVDEDDRRYGLNMLRMSDILMDMLAHLHDLSATDLRNLILPFVSLEKYRRVRRYPFGQFSRNQLEVLEEYHRRPGVTWYFRLDDVTPTSTGAVALVLSREPSEGARPVRILGMGQGFVDASMARRRGDPAIVTSIRDAFQRGCFDAGVSSDWYLDCDFAVIHDAFPSIEYSFLKELGLAPRAIIERMISGWTNPFGGLKGCGHALGASGLLQVAKSFHAFTGDPRYISGPPTPSPVPELVTDPPYQRCFTTSVGGVLANILVTLLETSRADGPNPPRGPRPALADPEPSPAHRFGPGRGLVLASTHLAHTPNFGDNTVTLLQHVHEPWIYLLAVDPDEEGFDKAFAFSQQRFRAGDRVRFSHITLVDEKDYVRVDALIESEPFCSAPVDEDRVRFLIELERRFQDHRPQPEPMLDTPRSLGDYLVYALIDERSHFDRFKARLLRTRFTADIGHPVSIRQLKNCTEADICRRIEEGWRRRAPVEHPSLLRVIEIGEAPADGRALFVTDYIEGSPLPTYLNVARAIPLERFLLWSTDLCLALAALHEAGLGHGALSPEYVVVTPHMRVLLIDPWIDGQGPATPDMTDDLRGLGEILHTLYTGRLPTWLDPERKLVDLGPAVSKGHPMVVRLLARLLGRDRMRPFTSLESVHEALSELQFQRNLELGTESS